MKTTQIFTSPKWKNKYFPFINLFVSNPDNFEDMLILFEKLKLNSSLPEMYEEELNFLRDFQSELTQNEFSMYQTNVELISNLLSDVDSIEEQPVFSIVDQTIYTREIYGLGIIDFPIFVFQASYPQEYYIPLHKELLVICIPPKEYILKDILQNHEIFANNPSPIIPWITNSNYRMNLEQTFLPYNLNNEIKTAEDLI